MLNDKLSAKLADNLCYLGDFATEMDYLTDNDGFLAALYHVELKDVEECIRENEMAMADWLACERSGADE